MLSTTNVRESCDVKIKKTTNARLVRLVPIVINRIDLDVINRKALDF